MSQQTYLQPSESLPNETTRRGSEVLSNLIADAVGNAVSEALGRHAAEQKNLGAVTDELLELKNCNMAQNRALDKQKHLLDDVVQALAEQKDLLQTIWRHAQSVGRQDLPMREPESKHSDGDAAASAKPAQLGGGDGEAQSAPAVLPTALVDLQSRTTAQHLSTVEDSNTAKKTSQELYAMGAAVSQGQQTRALFDLGDFDDALARATLLIEQFARNSAWSDSAVSSLRNRISELQEKLDLATTKMPVQMQTSRGVNELSSNVQLERFSNNGPIANFWEHIDQSCAPNSTMPHSVLPALRKNGMETTQGAMLALNAFPASCKHSMELPLAEMARPVQMETTQGVDGDPNEQFEDPAKPGNTWTKLTQAIRNDDAHQVLKLIEARADPDSKYFMTAEKKDCFYESPGAVYAVKNNNVSMLKLLLEQKATLQGKTGNYVDKRSGDKPVTVATHTLLWHACKFGKMDAVKFLLYECSDDLNLKVFDCRAHEGNEWNAPLHQAVVGGHCDVVKLLLEKRAQLAQESMKAAIFNGSFGCADICGILVKNSANIFEGDRGKRLFDYMLGNRNVAVLAAVADALTYNSRRVENLVQQMQEQDVICFMQTPGCEAIFDAIFRPKQLRDWRGKYLIFLNGCKINDKMININVAEGPDSEDIKNRSVEASSKNENFWMDFQNMKFLQELMPGVQDADLGEHIQVETRQCLIPNIHNSSKILWELVDGPNAEMALAGKPGAQALVTYCWQLEICLYRLDLAVHLLQAIIFLVFSYMIGRDVPAFWRYLLGSASNVLLSRHVYCQVTCWIGVWKLEERGLQSVLRFGAGFDLLRLVLIGFGNAMILGAEKFNVNEAMEIRITLGFLTFVLWTKVLYAQRGLAYAICMLPILAAMWSIWPFLLVMAWPSVGVANCYYLMNAYSEVKKVLTIVYRMTLLGDFDIEELENIDPTYHPRSDGIIDVESPVITKYHVAFVLFMVAFTMLFTIIMMNLLVGILYDAYSKALEDHQANCLQARASIVFVHLARRKGAEYLRQCFGCGCCNRRSRLAPLENKYLWFCHPAQPSRDSQDDAVQAENYLLQSLRDDMAQVKESLKTNNTDINGFSRQETPC